MSALSMFLKKNKVARENVSFPATRSLLDENNKPVLWTLRHVSTKEDEAIRDACTTEVPVPGKPGLFRYKVDANAYTAKLAAASVVFPDLFDAALQDSYGVKTPESLLCEIIDDPGEYAAFLAFVQQLNGFDVSFRDNVNNVKN